MTVEDLRREIRDLVESDVSSGRHPLRSYEKHRAFYCITGDKLDGASDGEVTFKLLRVLKGYGHPDIERKPYDCCSPLTKAELSVLKEVLQKEAQIEVAD